MKQLLPVMIVALPLPCAAQFEDLGPSPGIPAAISPSTAGVAFQLAGTAEALYCVALNAGVWKASARAGADMAWVQLANSPRYAHCIAVDPTNPAHVVVGEREGDALRSDGEQTGLWESLDGGATFPSYHDPSSKPPSGSQRTRAIRAVAITAAGTVLIATPRGIGRKARRATALDFSHSPVPAGDFLALATFRGLVFARTLGSVHVSRDDGRTWSAHAIPASVDSYTVGPASRGDVHSLAGIDLGAGRVYAYLPFKPHENIGNRNSLLVLDVGADTWRAQVLDNGDGTGLGGRRFVKSFDLTKQGLTDAVGERIRIVFCGAQDVSQASGIRADGTLEWRIVARTQAAAPPPGGTTDPVHSDVWDAHFDPEGRSLWLGTDGGVFAWPPLDEHGTWTGLNAGLHTQHVHALVAVPGSSGDLLAYATQDNDAWQRDEAGKWSVVGGTGDANWIACTEGEPRVVLSARHFQNAVLRNFGAGKPTDVRVGRCVLGNDLTFNGTQSFRFEPLARGETAGPLAGGTAALMLARLPLQYRAPAGTMVPVPGRLGQETSSGGPAILRNATFASAPDLDAGKGAGWEVAFDDVPQDVRGFWVASGGAHPGYYLYGENATGRRLLRRDAAARTWVPMALAGVNPMSEFGPLFVNPYDARELFASTATGVFASQDGGLTFTLDARLTALVSGDGKYPLAESFAGGNRRNVLHATQANPMCTLSCMAFLRDGPKTVVASSPFTGVFVRTNGKPWKDLSDQLPRPFTPVSTVAITPRSIYVGTEGRGVFAIGNH